jgi:hypothetical protein
MTDQKANPPDGTPNVRKPLNPEELGFQLEVRRQRLVQIRAMVHSQANILHESYNFDVGESDLGNCCDVGCDLLNRSIATLEPLRDSLSEGCAPKEPLRLSCIIEGVRQQLWRAESVLRAVANLMRSHEFADPEANLKMVMDTALEMLDDQISELEPLNLGLPVPLL